jgi:hypothetical protein
MITEIMVAGKGIFPDYHSSEARPAAGFAGQRMVVAPVAAQRSQGCTSSASRADRLQKQFTH